MATAPTFMELPLPPKWRAPQNILSGNFLLQTDNDTLAELTAIEVRNHIIRYWQQKDEDNERHRQSNQASRDTAPAQHPAGNSGGTTQGALSAGGATYAITSHPIQGTSALSQARIVLAQNPAELQAAQLQLQAAQLQQYSTGIGIMPLPYGAGGGFAYAGGGSAPAVTTVGETIPLPRTAPKAGELIGYRAWTTGGCLLSSYSASAVWYPHHPMHDKFGSAGKEIDDYNTAGIWSFKDPHRLATELGNLLRDRGVFGTVWIWGTVIEHEHGYRAQYAAIRSLDIASPSVDLERLRAIYLPKEPAK